MELNLKKMGYDHFEPVHFTPIPCETMREHIVPDSCADIARIVDTSAAVYVAGREVSADGRLCVSGTVDVSVIYIPEKGNGPCALRFQMPFQCYGDGQWEGNCEYPDVRGEVRSVDTRLLNPRKVLTRVDLLISPSGCRRVSFSLCTEAEEGEDLQLLRECRSTRVIAAVREKEFTFMEELPLSAGRDGAEEVLSVRLDIRGTDCKLIGSKLVVKGIIAAAVLYRENGGRLEQVCHELPFSQILDGSGMKEEWESDCTYRLLNAECRVGGEGDAEDHHILSLTLLLDARVTLWRTEEISFIADLYSTASPVRCETEEIALLEDSRRSVRRVNLRETLETGTAVKSLLDTEVTCGSVRRGTDAMEIPVWVRCLYMDENDTLHSVRREFTALCPMEPEDGDRPDCRASCHGDVMTSILPDGVELRFPVECSLETGRVNRYVCVSGGETEEEAEPSGQRPSIVLRKISTGEKLWSVAKQYRTTCASILEVNGLSDEHTLPCDRLLLIPRAR